MSYQTIERTVSSMRGYKNPLWTGSRVYSTKNGVASRIKWLCNEFGRDNVVHMPKKDDLNTEIVYIRVN